MEFPTSPTSNIMDKMGMQLLQRLSSSSLSASDASHGLSMFGKKVELSFNVLNLLEESFGSSLAGGKISSVSRKKGKAAVKNRHIDPLPFDSIKLSVPTTDWEARDVYAEALSQLRGILEVCGFIVTGLRVELNSFSITYSYSGSRRFQRFSNPCTSRHTYHRKKERINLRGHRSQRLSQCKTRSTLTASRGLESGRYCYPLEPGGIYGRSRALMVRCLRS